MQTGKTCLTFPTGAFSRGNGKKHGRCFQPERFRGGMGKNTADVSDLDLGGETNALALFSLPLNPLVFSCRKVRWMGRSRSTEASGGWVVSFYGYCAAFRRKNTAGKPLSARSRLIRPQILADRPLGLQPSGSFASRCALGAMRLAWHPIWRCGAGWGLSSPGRSGVVVPGCTQPKVCVFPAAPSVPSSRAGEFAL